MTILTELLKYLSGIKKYGNEQCYVCSLLVEDTIDHNNLSTQTLYQLSKISYYCQKYSISNVWLQRTLKRSDFKKKISGDDFLFLRSNLNYKLGNYSKVIKLTKRYFKKYNKLINQ